MVLKYRYLSIYMSLIYVSTNMQPKNIIINQIWLA